MDFIHYNPSEYPLSADDESTDEMNFSDLVIQYGGVQMLIDMDTIPIPELQSSEMEEVMENLVETFQEVTIKTPAKYKKYGQNQIERFIRMIQEEGLTVPKAAEQCGIPRSSAYKLLDEFNAGDGSVLPGNIPKALKREPKKLFPQHSAFLIELFDNNPSIVLEEARLKLCEHSNGLEISIPGLYKHIREKRSISLKQATKYTVERDAPRTLELRFNIVNQWKAAGVSFSENCVFVDEAGFHSQLMRSRAWSKVGDLAIVKVHTQKGVNISIIGCISPFGTVCFSKVEPLKKSDAALIEKEFPGSSPSKKKKAGSKSESKPIQLKQGTTAYHIVKFMESVMNILDKHNKKGMFIVMDKCRIHHSRFVVDAINQRGYKPLFMPQYSPFLNPIEECWSKIKKNIRRNPLDKSDMLTPRIAETCKQVTVADCQGWIRHAESYWDRCIEREIGLK